MNVNSGNSITNFELLTVPNQQYTVLPPNISSVYSSSLTSNGSGAIFQVTFGIESISVVDSGYGFVAPPQITIMDKNAFISPTIYPIMDNHVIRKIDTTIRFDRVSSSVEYVDPSLFYPNNYIVYSNSSMSFFQSIINGAAGANLTNISEWIPATNSNINMSTAVNRIMASYHPDANMFANRADLLMDGVIYGGISISGGNTQISYPVPTGSIFNNDDINYQSLNISWRPELISDSGLNQEHSRFGNSAGAFYVTTGQYLNANIDSPDINTLSVGSAPFTIEFFINFSNINSNISVLVDTRNDIGSSNGFVIYGNVSSLSFGSNTNIALLTTEPISFEPQNWNYITLNGDGSNIFAYINGKLSGNITTSYNFLDANITMGADINGKNVTDGYMDELRLTKNVSRYPSGVVDIPVPTVPFPRSISIDPYLTRLYTPLLWGFENFLNEGPSNIIFNSINSQKLLSDLSWNRKSLQLINYGSNTIIDSTTLPNIANQQILAVTLN